MMGGTATPFHQEEDSISPQAAFPSPALGSVSTQSSPQGSCSPGLSTPLFLLPPAGKDQTCHGASYQTIVPASSLTNSLSCSQTHLTAQAHGTLPQECSRAGLVVVTQPYAVAKTHRLAHSKGWLLLHVNYTVNLAFKNPQKKCLFWS